MPQTEDRPAADDPAFLARAQGVVDALAGQDPSVAVPAFFPLSAYLQVKELPKPMKPEEDWNTRLMGTYLEDLRGLAAADGAPAHLVRVEVPEKRVTWVVPGKEYNKLGYWRILGAVLVWEAGGEEHRTPVKTMISWRGQWYVVHLR